jgi:hypothetical protein
MLGDGIQKEQRRLDMNAHVLGGLLGITIDDGLHNQLMVIERDAVAARHRNCQMPDAVHAGAREAQ